MVESSSMHWVWLSISFATLAVSWAFMRWAPEVRDFFAPPRAEEKERDELLERISARESADREPIFDRQGMPVRPVNVPMPSLIPPVNTSDAADALLRLQRAAQRQQRLIAEGELPLNDTPEGIPAPVIRVNPPSDLLERRQLEARLHEALVSPRPLIIGMDLPIDTPIRRASFDQLISMPHKQRHPTAPNLLNEKKRVIDLDD